MTKTPALLCLLLFNMLHYCDDETDKRLTELEKFCQVDTSSMKICEGHEPNRDDDIEPIYSEAEYRSRFAGCDVIKGDIIVDQNYVVYKQFYNNIQYVAGSILVSDDDFSIECGDECSRAEPEGKFNSFENFSELKCTLGQINVSYNANLKDFVGLENLEKVGSFTSEENGIETLNGLENLKYVENSIGFYDEFFLDDITAILNLEHIGEIDLEKRELLTCDEINEVLNVINWPLRDCP